MENLWMCFNNLPVIFPLYTTYKGNDYITFGSILYVSSMSAISHLLENHKHGMPGFFNISPSLSYFFNRLDVLGSVLTVCRMAYLYYKKYSFNIYPLIHNYQLLMLLLISFACLKISEYDNQN